MLSIVLPILNSTQNTMRIVLQPSSYSPTLQFRHNSNEFFPLSALRAIDFDLPIVSIAIVSVAYTLSLLHVFAPSSNVPSFLPHSSIRLRSIKKLVFLPLSTAQFSLHFAMSLTLFVNPREITSEAWQAVNLPIEPAWEDQKGVKVDFFDYQWGLVEPFEEFFGKFSVSSVYILCISTDLHRQES